MRRCDTIESMATGTNALRDRLGAPGTGPILVAHRGARAYAPENTIAAFAKARGMGCEMIELDVHLSRDGQLVVHHDDDLLRCTDARERFPGRGDCFVSDFTLAEIKSLDAGAWFAAEIALPAERRQPFLRPLTPAERAAHIEEADLRACLEGRVKVPTLDEALAFAGAAGLSVNVEIKSIPRMYPGIASKVVGEVLAHGMAERVVVSSFDHQQLVEAKRLEPRLITGVLTSDRLARIGDYLTLLGADAYHPGCHGNYDSLGFSSVGGQLEIDEISGLLATGRYVVVWTCNETAQMRQLQSLRVSAIITDYPDRFPA